MTSIEQQARDLLDRMEVDGAQNFSSGELVELANLISEHHEDVRIIQALRRQRDEAEAAVARVRALCNPERGESQGRVWLKADILAALDTEAQS